MPAFDQPVRSSFITNLAWTFIVMTGFGTIITLFQYFVLNSVITDGFFQNALAGEKLPGFAQFLISNISMLSGLSFIMTVAVLVVSVGLLKRKNWARSIFVWIMALTALSHVAAAVFIQFQFPSIPITMPGADPEDFTHLFSMMKTAFAVLSLVFGGLFLWVMIKLMSKGIKAEFISSPPSRS